jgi:hypothetical protein
MATNEHKTQDLPRILLAVTVTMLAAVWGIQGIARQAEAFGPQVGDVVAFGTSHRPPFESAARLTADRADLPGCMLDVALMQKSGGSLIVDQRDTGPTRRYRAHWAGPRTSDGASDCGIDAELILTGSDLAALAAAAGGLGLHLY